MVQDGARYRAVVIGSSLGGVEALQAILGGLRRQLPVPVLVVQHRGSSPSVLDKVLARSSRLPVEWARDGAEAEAGHVYLCPGGSLLRLEPDGTLTVQPHGRATSLGTVDELFRSAADALGHEVFAVVLSGAGSDGTAGARAVKDAGGTVTAQDGLTSAAFGMPESVIEAGLADLIMPLGEIPDLLDRVIGEGRRLPSPGVLAAEAVFAAGGDMGALMAATDWSLFPLGPVEQWPAVLRVTLAMALSSDIPMTLLWGREMTQLYNDAYRQLIGPHHPGALGRPVLHNWRDIAAEFEPQIRKVWETGRAVVQHDARFVAQRDGYDEELFLTVCYSPLRDGGEMTGLLATLVDTTEQVRANRRLRTLHRLASVAARVTEPPVTMCAQLAEVLADNHDDNPFALVYLTDSTGTVLHLEAATGVERGQPAAPAQLGGRGVAPWPTVPALRRRETVLVDDLSTRFPGLICPPCPEAPDRALVLPAGLRPDGVPPAVVIAGINPLIPLHADYRSYLDLMAEQIGAAVMAARHRQDEHDRIVALAALDRAKTEFFAGVSHEFRTPITLLLGPLDELASDPDLSPGHIAEVRLAQRNARRLLKLVNTLLEFARLEQGRTMPRIDAVDLAVLTTDVVSVFRSATAQAGLRLVVDCPPLGRPVPVDPDMWESIVLNLVANALKHTFSGTITVALALQRNHVELSVTDTGIGIDDAEIPHLFERFHQVRGARARSEEGSGIGLALVHQLVRLHHGSVRVRSEVGAGTTFTVWVPLTQRWRRDQATGGEEGDTADDDRRVARRRAFAEEADLWLADGSPAEPAALDRRAPAGAGGRGDAGPSGRGSGQTGPRARVLVVDDNADLRDYVRRLLEDRYDVVAVADGRQALDALDALDAHPFDLVLSDVMMPVLDGVELLTRVRADPRLRATPVILLTALADATRAADGLAAGAHDYVVKPFTARELLTRVEAQLALARLQDGRSGHPGRSGEPIAAVPE